MAPLYVMLAGLVIAALAFSLPLIVRGWREGKAKP